MNCVFCKKDSSQSRSVEHIIPESLGNWEHALPRGVVCDQCNNYLSREVEKPLLETPYFREMRFRARIQTKRGHPPSVLGIHLPSRTPVSLYPNMDGEGVSVSATHPEDEAVWIRSMKISTRGTFLVPMGDKPNERLLSRFLGKVAIEVLALRLLDAPHGLDEFVHKRELDELRDYVRRGASARVWPYHERRLYPPEFVFYESGYGPYEVLNEWTFLYTDHQELYLVLALFGVEYAFNLGGPEIEGYERWVSENSGRSPLYPEGAASTQQRIQPD